MHVLMKITHCWDGQFNWFVGHIEKAAFSG